MTISAPLYRLPDAQLVSIEYPGPVASTSSSLNVAVGTLGGQDRLTRALSKPDGVVELNFRPENNFSHPVGGETVEAGNMAVLRIIKRRRRAGRKKSKIVGEHLVEEAGAYTVQCVGSIAKSVRFIGEDRSSTGSVFDVLKDSSCSNGRPAVCSSWGTRGSNSQACSRDAQHGLWAARIRIGEVVLIETPHLVDTIQRYRFPEPDEDFEGNLHLLPPPVFSRLTVPQIYECASPLICCPETSTDPSVQLPP